MPTARFRILQISDIHLATKANRWSWPDAWELLLEESALAAIYRARLPSLLPSSYDPALLQELARFALSRAAEIDFILITGDIATTGRKDDLLKGLEFIDTAAVRGSRNQHGNSTLQAAGVPIVLLPGNHDRYASIIATPNCRRFDSTFVNYWRPPGGLIDAVHVRRFGSSGQTLAILSVDFTLERRKHATEKPWGVWGQGRAYENRLECLISETQRIHREDQDDATIVVWAMHFPPMAICEPPLKLINARHAVIAARSVGVSLILAGHLHDSRYYQFDSIPEVSVWCAGTATSVTPSNQNAVYFLEFEMSDGRMVNFTPRTFAWSWDLQTYNEVPTPRQEIVHIA